VLDSLFAPHVRLLIASRQPIFLDGLEALLHRVHDFSVLARCEDDDEITEKIRELAPYSFDKTTTTAALSRLVRREAAERRLARAGLTAREFEITRLAGVGVPNVAIGTRLRISPGTVKIHLHQIYRKLGLAGRTALMGYAREHDIVQR
jgi:DNA-binding NarL/FixJ family response regulator